MRLAVHLICALSLALLMSACNATGPGLAPAGTAGPSDTPVPASPSAGPASLRVVGTEPFWGISIEGDRLHFTTAEDQVGKHLVAAPAQESTGLRYAGQGQGGTAFELRLVRGECSDGMSDRTYAYGATFRYGTVDYRGCADTAAALEAQPAP